MKDVATGTSPAPANAAEAIRNVVVMLLMSPRFVNHLELEGTPIAGRADYLALDPYEIASRLSYTFWQTLPDDALLAAARRRIARHRRRLRRAARPRVRRPAHARHHLAVLERVDALRSVHRLLVGAPRRSWRWPPARTWASPGTTTRATWCRRSATSTELYTWTHAGDAARSADHRPVGHALGRSGAPLRRAGLERQRRLPALHRRQPRAGILQRAALLVSSLEQTNPFHRGAFVRRSILCDNLPRPDPNSLPPGSLDPPPPSTGETTRQRYQAKVDGNGLCQGCHDSFSNLGYVMEATTPSAASAPREKVFDEQTGALLATLPIDTTAVPQVIARRHAAGQRARRAEPAHRRQRQGRGLPVGELLPLRAAPRSDTRQRRRLRVRGDARQPRRRAAPGAPRSAAWPPSAGFRQHKVGAP